jgi:hypothetical protein
MLIVVVDRDPDGFSASVLTGVSLGYSFIRRSRFVLPELCIPHAKRVIFVSARRLIGN